MNIPMGGFLFQMGYQRLFYFDSTKESLSIADYYGTYMLGIGIPLNRDLILTIYHKRFLLDKKSFFSDDKRGAFGIGLKFNLF